jgi:thiol-disulfide isomerase/thioredoxin
MPVSMMAMRAKRLAVALGGLALTMALAAPPAPAADTSETTSRAGPIERGNDADAAALLGKRPPELPALHWLDGKPRSLASLRGHVVVIRSFTAGCPFCASTMPTLEKWQQDLGPRGLQVLGVYHPKPARPISDAEVATASRALGVTTFPVASDPVWALVKRWWLQPTQGSWTSFTFILDRRGVVRYVHPGGAFHGGGGPDHATCRADEQNMRALIEQLLAEKIG